MTATPPEAAPDAGRKEASRAIGAAKHASKAKGREAMTQRKGEISRAGFKRRWPPRVALPADKVRDPTDRQVIFCAAGVLSASPLTYSLRRNHSDAVVFCFAEPEDAEAFAKRFAGEPFPTNSRR